MQGKKVINDKFKAKKELHTSKHELRRVKIYDKGLSFSEYSEGHFFPY